MSPDLVTFGEVDRLLPEPMLLVDSTGVVRDANPAALRVFALPLADLRSRALSDLIATDNDRVMAYLRLCSGSRQFVPGSLTLGHGEMAARYRTDGAVVRPAGGVEPAIVLLRLRPREVAGSAFRFLSAQVDDLQRAVVSRMRAEALVDGQRRVLEMVARGAPLTDTLEELTLITEAQSPGGQWVSILLLDDDGRRLMDGAGGRLPPTYRQAIHGVAIGPAVGSCGTAAHANRPVIVSDIATDPLWADYRALALQHGLRACWSTPIRANDGSVLGTFALYYSEARTPLPEDQRVVDTMTRVAAIAIERTRIERQVRDLLERERAARAEAEEANRAKDEFLAVVSHELRSPLNAIVGWVRLLGQDPSNAAIQARAIETIDRNARLQGELINDVLDFARITSGRLTLDLELVPLRAVVTRACESVAPEARSRNLELVVEVDVPETPVAVDPNRLQQAVSNVLWNAIKFTPSGGRITVEVFREGGLAHIRVTDTGCGISPDFLPDVFKRFRQADAGPARKHGGLGLGLAIVQHLVELHGGHVHAASPGLGQGATFTLSVPMRPGRPPEAPSVRAPSRVSLAGVHLLVVDDLADVRDLLDIAATRVGARVSVAASAEEALDLLHRERPDVLVCDIGLPGRDGYELLRIWRAAETSRRLPAVALTAHGRDADRRRAFDAGFDRHVAKPFDPLTLLDLVAELAGTEMGPTASEAVR